MNKSREGDAARLLTATSLSNKTYLQAYALLDSNSIFWSHCFLQVLCGRHDPPVFWILGIVGVQHESAATGRKVEAAGKERDR